MKQREYACKLGDSTTGVAKIFYMLCRHYAQIPIPLFEYGCAAISRGSITAKCQSITNLFFRITSGPGRNPESSLLVYK
jgi:hypothetical protein